ncbi:MAG: gamma-glutamyl-gamma-aminobutyrate hydrolase family protein [Hyphomicrobiaceae bacterium]
MSRRRSKPVIGIIANTRTVDGGFKVQFAGLRNMRAVADVAGALPLIVPGMPDHFDAETVLSVVDGVLLTGGRANVHPTHYGHEPTPAHEPFDEHRDAVALPVVRACVDRGVPIFGICRGLQEMNVAFGGTLHPEIRELPGRMNHRMTRLPSGEPHPDPNVIFAERHDVTLTPDGCFERLLGRRTIRVNSLHGQGIERIGDGIVVEGVAEDGTIEAISISGAPGFALGVQWHAEYEPHANAINRTLFEAFGAAVADYAARRVGIGR